MRRSKNKLSTFKAAILAAVEGSRLKAQGVATPKPLIPIQGTPMIERILRQLQTVGASEVFCIINNDSPAVLQYVQSRRLEVPVHLVVKSTPSSFHSLCELIKVLQNGPFLLSLVDSIFAIRDLDQFVHYARSHSRLDGLLAVTDFVEDETPLRIQLGKNKQVIALGRDAESSPLVTGGIYWLSERVLDPANEALQIGVSRMRHFLAFLLEKGYALKGYRFRKIVDVDTTEDMMLAERFGEKKEWDLTSQVSAEAPNFRPTN